MQTTMYLVASSIIGGAITAYIAVGIDKIIFFYLTSTLSWLI